MEEFEAYLSLNPLAERDTTILREALSVLAQLRDAGLDQADTYELAPSFGSRTLLVPRQTVADLRAAWSR